MFLQAWEDLAKAKFDKPSPVHFRCVFPQAKEEEDQEAATDPNPTIKLNHPAGRDHDDVTPFSTVYQVPRVRKVRKSAVAIEDIELDR